MTRLRALVVLPTRDLVVQVRETFEAIAKGRGLKVGSSTPALFISNFDLPLSLDRLCNWPAIILSRTSSAREQRADVRTGSLCKDIHNRLTPRFFFEQPARGLQ